MYGGGRLVMGAYIHFHTGSSVFEAIVQFFTFHLTESTTCSIFRLISICKLLVHSSDLITLQTLILWLKHLCKYYSRWSEANEIFHSKNGPQSTTSCCFFTFNTFSNLIFLQVSQHFEFLLQLCNFSNALIIECSLWYKNHD
jgi:hypothetical protein